MPPYDLPTQATRSTFKSRSSIGPAADYNEFRFEDLAGREEVYLRAQRDLNGDIRNDMTLSTGSAATVTAKTKTRIEATPLPGSPLGSSVQVDSTGLVTVSGTVNIVLQAGPDGVPIAEVLINEAGVILRGPTIDLVSGVITMSSPPIFPPV
jgi:type VI secretion system secreted protein VgrG